MLPNSIGLIGEPGRELDRECWGVETRARFRPGKVLYDDGAVEELLETR